MSRRIEVYRQDVWNGGAPPSGPGWEPSAATAAVRHSGMRESIGGKYAVGEEIIWWYRVVTGDAGDDADHEYLDAALMALGAEEADDE